MGRALGEAAGKGKAARRARFTRGGRSGIGGECRSSPSKIAATLHLVIEPSGKTHEVPYLATAGIRYTLDDGVEDRSTCVVGDDRIEFWCNAEGVEVDIVYPSPCEKLHWDLCADLGFCGGLVNGVPTYVSDLLPAGGSIDAKTFATLVLQAEGDWPNMDEARLRWVETLKAKFVEHLGAAVVAVETLHEAPRRPFDSPDPD